MIKDNPYYSKVRNKTRLYSAWRRVYENGIISKSIETKNEIKDFSGIALKEINRIADHLYKNKFIFAPAQGILKKRPNKNPRPIVVSPIPNRIVQRSILDVLQEEPEIQQYISVPTSFGGIEKRGVTSAVRASYDAMRNGAAWYIRSDIEGFFTQIPREKVLQIISDKIADTLFNQLLASAVTIELANLAELGINAELFPYEIGVAQGCCLSPLIGNILLHEFDIKMNGDNFICLRYIDDFLIMGSSEKIVMQAFKKAVRLLSEHKLNAYNPLENKDKANIGKTEKGFEFLGCDIHPGLIRPDKKSRKRLLTKIDDLFRESVQLMSDPPKLCHKRKTFIETLNDASNIVRGWGNQYSFCNDIAVINYLDDEIDKLVQNYIRCYEEVKKMTRQDHKKNHRRLLGVHLLSDSKKEPIIKS